MNKRVPKNRFINLPVTTDVLRHNLWTLWKWPPVLWQQIQHLMRWLMRSRHAVNASPMTSGGTHLSQKLLLCRKTLQVTAISLLLCNCLLQGLLSAVVSWSVLSVCEADMVIPQTEHNSISAIDDNHMWAMWGFASCTFWQQSMSTFPKQKDAFPLTKCYQHFSNGNDTTTK